MIKFIRKLLGLCDHTWEDYGVVNNVCGKYQVGRRQIQRCYHCSKFRTVKIF